MNLLTDNLKKYNWIDFGRGIAVLLVIMIHTGQNFSTSESVYNITQTGSMGVQLFFILSSFTLFNSYNQRYEIDGKYRIKYFFIRRFFRIAPLYYFFAIFYTVIQIVLKGIHSVEYMDVLISILFLNGLVVPVINYIPPGGWSVGTEVLFYCIIPFLFKKITSTKHAIILLLAAILFSNLINYLAEFIISSLKIPNPYNLRGYHLYSWLPNQFPVFCFGILLFFILNSLSFSNNLKKIFLTFSILLYILLSQIHLSFKYLYFLLQTSYLYSVIFCFFIIGIKYYKFNNRVGSVFRMIGKYSFCMYLLHFFILRLYLILITYIGVEKNNLMFLISYVIISMITFFISSKFYIYEKKGIMFGNMQIQKIRNLI